MSLFGDAIGAGAHFDADRRYRYRLFREWSSGSGTCLWLMLNPSTADETVLDPTLRRCLDYSKRWGYKRMDIANLYALRSTDPDVLLTAPEPIGPLNDAHIFTAAENASIIICGWGTHQAVAGRSERVLAMLRGSGFGHKLRLLRLTKQGRPEHPLYLPKTLEPQPLQA